jgi:hypothetical protein
MAVNKKGGGVNTLASDDEFGLADLGRLEEQYAHEPAAFREMRFRAQRARTAINAIEQLEASSPGTSQLPVFQRQLRNAQYAKANLEPRMALYKQSTRERINEQAVNVIGREYSERAVNSYVASNSNNLEAQVAGAQMAQQGYVPLAQQRSNIMNQMQGLRQESMNAASDYIVGRGVNPASAAVLQGNAAQMKDLAQQLIPITLAMQQLKQQGLDPQGRQRALVNVGDKAAGVLAYNQLEHEMQSGKGLGALSASDLKKKEAEAAEKLIKALNELSNSAGKSGKELEALNKTAEEAAKEFEDISDAKKMGGNSNNGYRAGMAWASVVGQAASLVGNTIQTMGIDQPMAKMANIAGHANIENQKYDMWRAGNEGDMTARLNMAGWKNAAAFGQQLSDNAKWVVGSRITGGVATAIGGGLQVADAISSLPGNIAASKVIKDPNAVQNIAGGFLAAGEGVAMGLIYGRDAADNLSASQAAIAAQAQAMQATKALTHIPGYQLQQYRNHQMGLLKAAQGLGINANPFIDQAGSEGFLNRMSGVLLGGAEMGQLSAFGAANMGSTFSADQAIMAKHYENLALGSSQENMQRMAGFAAAGAQNPLQSTAAMLERAVGSGINSSKALNIIAENTGELVEQTNLRGSAFDTTDTASSLILAALDKTTLNREFASKQAANTFKTEEQWKTNTSTSFAGMVGLARMQKDLGLDYASALGMQNAPTAMWQEWAKQARMGNIDQVRQDMFTQGIDVTNNALFKEDPNKFFSVTGENKVLNQLERGGAGWAFGATQTFADLKQWIGADPKRQAMFTGNVGLFDESTPEWVRQAIKTINQSIATQNGNPMAVRRDMGVGLGWLAAGDATLPGEGELPPGPYSLQQRENMRGEVQRNKAAIVGLQWMAGAGASGTTGALGTWASGEANQALPGENAEQKWATAAAESAASFGQSAIKLDGASGKLLEAAEKLMAYAGTGQMGVLDGLKREVKKMEKKLDSLVNDPTLQKVSKKGQDS